MTRTLVWWHLAVGAVCAGLAVFLIADGVSGWRLALGLAALAGFAAAWYGLGSRAARGGRAAIAFQALVILAGGAAAAAAPTLAVLQAVAYPALWVTSETRRRAIGASALLATAVGIGFLVSVGTDQEGLGAAALTAGLSLSFTIAMGLWMSSIADESEARRALVAELEATQAALAAASRDAGVTSERERFARDLHDTVAQDLTGLVMGLRRAGHLVESGDHEQAGAILADLQTAAESALAEARALVASSAPPALDDGVAAALERLAERVGREAGLAASTSVDPRIGALPRETEVVLVRIAQEALSNVRRHAGAAAVTLRLARVADGGDPAIRLEVVDDGHGFDVDAAARGFGLDGMRERLDLVGGRLVVESGPSGTRLAATVPLAALSQAPPVPTAAAAVDATQDGGER